MRVYKLRVVADDWGEVDWRLAARGGAVMLWIWIGVGAVVIAWLFWVRGYGVGVRETERRWSEAVGRADDARAREKDQR